MEGVFLHHELPRCIISDRDSKFSSKFWKAFFQATGTKLAFSTAYHPETDGQTERVNQTIEDILRAYCLRESGKWTRYLYLVEFAYNALSCGKNHQSLYEVPTHTHLENTRQQRGTTGLSRNTNKTHTHQ